MCVCVLSPYRMAVVMLMICYSVGVWDGLLPPSPTDGGLSAPRRRSGSHAAALPQRQPRCRPLPPLLSPWSMPGGNCLLQPLFPGTVQNTRSAHHRGAPPTAGPWSIGGSMALPKTCAQGWSHLIGQLWARPPRNGTQVRWGGRRPGGRSKVGRNLPRRAGIWTKQQHSRQQLVVVKPTRKVSSRLCSVAGLASFSSQLRPSLRTT